MNKSINKVLADVLVKNNIISLQDSQQHLAAVLNSSDSLYAHLVSKGILTDEQILSVLSTTFNIGVVNLNDSPVDRLAIEKVPVKFTWYYKCFPVKLDQKIVTLAFSVPPDMRTQDEIRVYLGLEPKILLAKERDILEAIKKNYGLGSETIDQILSKDPIKKSSGENLQEAWVEDIEKAEDASVGKLVNQIIFEAYQKRATDIHIEPYRNKVRLRYRVDGTLVDANISSDVKHFLLQIVARIKVMANLSIVEKRLPQDGSAIVKTKDQDLDLRVSTIPTPRGESMVIRILPTKVMLYSLEKLGLEQGNVKIFRELVKRPHGIVFVTGPTGSGKTTTLYACLNEINSAQRKIITIEDPIEYEMEGITQIQVNPKVNLDFSAGLRSVLRHDPDILMVGEVRDVETAEIAIRTALTGHLVFSTLHTNDASSGVTRLIEMGLEPYLVASSVEAFVAQRLVRIICSHCKEEVRLPLLEVKEEISSSLNISNLDEIKIYRGRGCDQCNQTGFYGRTAVYEILVVNEEIRIAILEKPRAEYIKQLAMAQGMITLRQDGWRKVLAGITTPTEVMNVTAKDQFIHREEKKLPVKSTVSTALTIHKNNLPMTTDESVITVKPQMHKRPEGQLYRLVPHEVLNATNEYESRAYPRLYEAIPIRYKILGADPNNPTIFRLDNVEYSTLTEDISAGGVSFLSGSATQPDSIIGLQIHLEKHERSISCLARVCRLEENTLTHQFRVVIYYLDMTSADRVKLNNFIKARIPPAGIT